MASSVIPTIKPYTGPANNFNFQYTFKDKNGKDRNFTERKNAETVFNQIYGNDISTIQQPKNKVRTSNAWGDHSNELREFSNLAYKLNQGDKSVLTRMNELSKVIGRSGDWEKWYGNKDTLDRDIKEGRIYRPEGYYTKDEEESYLLKQADTLMQKYLKGDKSVQGQLKDIMYNQLKNYGHNYTNFGKFTEALSGQMYYSSPFINSTTKSTPRNTTSKPTTTLDNDNLVDAIISGDSNSTTPYTTSKTTDTNTDELINLLADKINSDRTLSRAEALSIAKNQIGGLYDDKNKQILEGMDKDALRRGFFGQLPTEALRQNTTMSLENQKRSAISDLANQLRSQSFDESVTTNQLQNQNITNLLNILTDKERYADSRKDVEWQQDFAEQQYRDSRSDIDFEKAFKDREYIDSRGDMDWEKLFKERQYLDSRGDVDWEKAFKEMAFQSDNTYKMLELLKDERFYDDQRNDIEWEQLFKESVQLFNQNLAQENQDFNHKVTEAQLTGYWEGEPTMAMQNLLFDMGMDKEKAKLQQKQINTSISQSWARIANDNAALEHRIEQDAQEAERFEKQYNKSINDAALGLTYKSLSGNSKYINSETGQFDFSSVSPEDFQYTFERYVDYMIDKTETDIKNNPDFAEVLKNNNYGNIVNLPE